MENNTYDLSKLNTAVDTFLGKDKQTVENEMDCESGVCILRGDKSLVERVNKKMITEDGRQLLT